jgi:hypothetical protein
VGEMGHRDEFEAPIEDAKYLVLLKVEQIYVLGNLCVGRRISESKVAITFA